MGWEARLRDSGWHFSHLEPPDDPRMTGAWVVIVDGQGVEMMRYFNGRIVFPRDDPA